MFDGLETFIDKPVIPLHPDRHIAEMQFAALQSVLRSMTQEGHAHINSNNPKWFYIQACQGLEQADKLSKKPIYAATYAERTKLLESNHNFK